VIDIDKLHDQAEAAIATHRLDEARTIYTRICEIDNADVGPRMMLGAIEREDGNLELAASHLSTATSLDPDFTEAWVMLGGVYGQLERLTDSEAANRHALALDSKLADAQLNLANALKGQGIFEEAAQQ
jgi:cytochrome c-type biogenesis protein CcmH/NrfG